jgi:import inner membrane translocase subunit TIM50
MDTVAGHAKNQPENAIILPKWSGSPNDKDLVSYIPFLEYIATMGITDVRNVLASFPSDGPTSTIPAEFARREALARQEFDRQLAAKPKRRKSIGSLSSLVGIKTEGPIGGLEDYEKGKMMQDQARERGQKNYEALAKELRENGEKWLKEMKEEEEKAQREQVNSMKTSMKTTVGSVFGGGSVAK